MQGIFGTKDLSVVYNKGTPAESIALQGVSFYALPEEFVVVFGPSGCGKSTLLYTLTGIERHINGGEVWLHDKKVDSMSPLDLLELHRRDVGMIFQSYNLVSTLNILNNVTLPLLAAGVPESTRRKNAESLLDRFLIGHLAKRYPSQLSGGQQQRVAIARALVTDPDIIVADEPTGNLDSQSSEIVLQQLLELNVRYKKTILLVTHDPSFLAYADRVLHMKDGTIVKVEEKEGLREITNAPAIPLGGKPDERLGTSPFDADRTDELSFEDFSRVACVADFVSSVAKDSEAILSNRFRHILVEVALEKLSRKDALLFLQKPVPQGGMGYSLEYAMNILVELDELFELRHFLMGRPPNARLSSVAQLYIARWVLGARFGTLASTQSELFGKYMVDYLSQRIDRAEFARLLEESVEHGGVGLLGFNTEQLVEKLGQIKDLIPLSTPWSA